MVYDPTVPTLADVFDPEPAGWGYRGDPHVWRALREHLSGTEVPASVDQVATLLYDAFRELVGVDLATEPAAYVTRGRYAHGGISSGMISLEAWRERLLPILLHRARELLEPGSRTTDQA